MNHEQYLLVDTSQLPRFSEAFDAYLIEKQRQRDNVAKTISTFDLSGLYEDSHATGTYPIEGADLSF